MAQNILRVYKSITIELLEDICKFFDGKNYIGDGKIETWTEGPVAVQEAIYYLKESKDIIKPMLWNNYAGKAAQKLAHDINTT